MKVYLDLCCKIALTSYVMLALLLSIHFGFKFYGAFSLIKSKELSDLNSYWLSTCFEASDIKIAWPIKLGFHPTSHSTWFDMQLPCKLDVGTFNLL